MSILELNEPLDSQLRNRILTHASDVPVFENYFRLKNQITALSADPGSGQTPGFAPKTETQPELPASSPYSFLFDDPALIHSGVDSGNLRAHLLGLPARVSVFESPTQGFPVITTTSTQGVHLAPADWRPTIYVPPTILERVNVHMISSLSWVESIWTRIRPFFGRVNPTQIRSRVNNLSVRLGGKSIAVALETIASLCTVLALWGDLQAILGRKLVQGSLALRSVLWSVMEKLRSRSGTLRLLSINFSLPRLAFAMPGRPALLSLAGQGMMVGALVIFLMTLGPVIRLQAGEWWTKSRTAITGKAIEPQVKPVLTDTVRKPEEVPPEEKQFQLLIPKLDANMKVVANVDAGDEKAYAQALKKGVAHAAGTGLPGEANITNKSIYIFGHSTNAIWNIERYNALFYSLKDLSQGDEILIWFWGKQFRYTVKEVVKVDPKDLTFLTPQTDKDQLILQTCWPPGTTWKRLLVIAEPE